MQNTTKIKNEKNLKPNPLLRPLDSKSFTIIGNLLGNEVEKTSVQKHRNFRGFVFRFSKMFSGVLGFTIFAFIVLGAIIIPFFSQNYNGAFDVEKSNLKPFQDGHILGTNYLGQDIWSMLWHGLRFSLLLSLVVTLFDLVIGVFLGIISGYFERFDRFLQNIILILQNTPNFLILVLMSLIFTPSFWVFVISFATTGWIGMSLQVRSQIKRAKNFQWVEASRVLGTKKSRVMFNFLPLLVPIIVVQLTFTIPAVISSEVALSFLGLKIQDQATLGILIEQGKKFITLYPRLVIIPSSFLVLIIVSVQFIGNSLETALRRTR